MEYCELHNSVNMQQDNLFISTDASLYSTCSAGIISCYCCYYGYQFPYTEDQSVLDIDHMIVT